MDNAGSTAIIAVEGVFLQPQRTSSGARRFWREGLEVYMQIGFNWIGEECSATAEDLKLISQQFRALSREQTELVFSFLPQSWQRLSEEGRNLIRGSLRRDDL